MHQRIAVVIGDGQMAAQCAKVIAGHAALTLPLIVHHHSAHGWSSQIEKFTREHGVRGLLVDNVNDADVIREIEAAKPDIIFSVNNWDVIRADLLAIPPDGILNFHNGPLPAYRGVNVPSWAIINGERSHGVTWHYVSGSIDAGDVVARASFELAEDETAISLTFRCIEAGLKLLPTLLDQYVAGKLEALPQQGEARYYSFRDSPNQGYLDFTLGFDKLSALVRGLSFRPFENQFTYPKVHAPEGDVYVTEVTRVDDRPSDSKWLCGEVRAIEDGAILVRSGDSLIRLSGLMDPALANIDDARGIEARGLRAGTILAAPAPDKRAPAQ